MDFDEDEAIANFCAVTGADDTTARHYLGAADGDVDAAVMFYLENGTNVTGNAIPSNLQATTEKSVRAPIAPRRAVLVDDFASSSVASNTFVPSRGPTLATPIEPFRDVRIEGAGSNNGREPLGLTSPTLSNVAPLTNFASPFLGGTAEPSGERGIRLAQLFRPPTEIIFAGGGMEAARKVAREQSKWLLVTIHNPAEFPCQLMVRDVWKEEAIEEFIRESFIFLFLTLGSSEAQRYCQYYPFEGYPHWAIIDARTGKRVKSWAGRVIKAPEMLMELVDFVAEQPLSPGDLKRQSPISVDDDEQSKDEQAETQTITDSHIEKTSAKVAKAELVLPEEPASDHPQAITLQIRFSDGARQRRRFLLSDSVQRIFDVIKLLDNGIQDGDESFDLIVGPGTSLRNFRDEPLEKHNLRNATVTVIRLE